MQEEQNKKENPAIKWLKRLGFAGFMFFFIKGLIWLAVIIGATYFGYNVFE
ncbi:MAG: alanyl-tRNA synthetase [Blastocatellia bacterium]|nr:alanyl-tRNA synthetase [Blastocatellia bacterium]